MMSTGQIEIDTFASETFKDARRLLSVSFHTLGCRLNQSESSALEGGFETEGFHVVSDTTLSDISIINTCFVTGQAEAKCRNLIRRLLRKNPETFIAVTGCYAQAGMEALSQIGGIDLIAGTDHKMRLPALVRQVIERETISDGVIVQKCATPIVYHSARISRDDFTIPNLSVLDSFTRPNVKIQDGCDFFCSFCIIPTTRGRSRSRDFEDILREVKTWVKRGHLEIVLTGVNLGAYFFEGRDLADLIESMEKIDGLERIRISSIEPTTISDRLVDLMANSTKLCPYLHLPLQSGSNRILSDMGRRYTSEDYRSFILEIMERIPHLGLGTDVMVGFPGEDDTAFQETVSLIESLPFSYLHVFPYSRREGTRVTRSDLTPVGPALIKARSADLCALSGKKRFVFYRQSIGKTVPVLFETKMEDACFSGLTDSYIRVAVPSDQDLSGRIAKVYIHSIEGRLAKGSLVQ